MICTVEQAFKAGPVHDNRPAGDGSITLEEVREKDTNVLPGSVNLLPT